MSKPVPTIEFLHTAKIHVDTFEALHGPHGAEVQRRHEVRDDWLDRARTEGLSAALRDEVTQHLEQAAARSTVVVCTCSTLGPIADEVGATHPSVFRIDRPMIEAAARLDGTCVVAVCLETTIAPTTSLLVDACRRAKRACDYAVVSCEAAWPRFEAGDMEGYAAEIARAVRDGLERVEHPSCVVLAQGSMAVAEPLLRATNVPILSSPKLAANEALERARRD